MYLFQHLRAVVNIVFASIIAFYWSAYELMKARNETPTFGATFIAGASSGMVRTNFSI